MAINLPCMWCDGAPEYSLVDTGQGWERVETPGLGLCRRCIGPEQEYMQGRITHKQLVTRLRQRRAV